MCRASRSRWWTPPPRATPSTPASPPVWRWACRRLDAVKVGHAAAALSVTAFGAQGGMPRMEQLLPLLADGWKEKLGL